MRMLLDTNIILEHLRSGLLFSAPLQANFFISTIIEAELLRYGGLGQSEIVLIEEFISVTTSLPVTSDIARKAALLGRTRKTKLSDLLIAATALEYNLPVITKNLADFKNIPGLTVRSSVVG